jgi:transcriptional regulator with XRE-family HTH domain
MALSRLDRKAELVRRGLTLEAIAAELGTSSAYVSRVMNELDLHGPTAQRVMVYVAEQLGMKVEKVFPVEVVKVYRRKELVG